MKINWESNTGEMIKFAIAAVVIVGVMVTMSYIENRIWGCNICDKMREIECE